MKPGWFGLRDAGMASRLSFLSVAVWWVAFSIPLFRRVSEPPVEARRRGAGGRQHRSRVVRASCADTLREFRKYRQAWLMLLAFLIYNDGIGTIIRMAAHLRRRDRTCPRAR